MKQQPRLSLSMTNCLEKQFLSLISESCTRKKKSPSCVCDPLTPWFDRTNTQRSESGRSVFSCWRQACGALSKPETRFPDLLHVFTRDCGHVTETRNIRPISLLPDFSSFTEIQHLPESAGKKFFHHYNRITH